jgi:hypothetical protein
MFSTPGVTPTAVVVLLCLLGTVFLLMLLVALYASVRWMRGSASTRRPKPSSSTAPIQTSDLEARVAQMAADQAALFSTLEKLTTTIKRLSSRAGMQDRRERSKEEREFADQASPPPVGASKTELLRHYGMAGKIGPDFARAQQQYETRKKEETN